MRICNIAELCYELYKIDWLNNNVSARTQMDNIMDYYEYRKSDSYVDTYEGYLNEAGFGFEIYASFDEFLENEYRQGEYIAELLADNEDLLKEYRDDVSPSDCENHEEPVMSDCKYYGVSQMNRGHEYRWIFDDKTLKSRLGTDDVLSMSGENIRFPLEGSDVSATWIQALPDLVTANDFLTARGDGPDSSDPELIDIAEYLLTVEVDSDSCTKSFLDVLGLDQGSLTQYDDEYGHHNRARAMISDLQKAGYVGIDYANPFYGDNSDMRYSELCDIFEKEIKA